MEWTCVCQPDAAMGSDIRATDRRVRSVRASNGIVEGGQPDTATWGPLWACGEGESRRAFVGARAWGPVGLPIRGIETWEGGWRLGRQRGS